MNRNSTLHSSPANISSPKELKHRDQEFLLSIYDKYSRPLMTFIFKIVPNKRLAEEVLEKTFEKVISEAKNFDNRQELIFIELLNTARTEAIEKLISSQSKQLNVTMQMGCRSTLPVQKFIQLLDSIEKTIFSLMYYRSFSYEQIAELLRIKVDIIKIKALSASAKIQDLYPTNYTANSSASTISFR